MDEDKNRSSTLLNLAELAQKRFKLFQDQTFENGHFDVTFGFPDEKRLYAHKFILWSASPVFEAMFFGNWGTQDPIPITTSSCDDFIEMISFLYIGQCNITPETAVALVDLAQAYQIDSFKTYLDDFISQLPVAPKDALKCLEVAKRYTLPKSSLVIMGVIENDTEDVFKNVDFSEVSKEILIDIAKMEHFAMKEEAFFEIVIKWGEHQINQKLETPTQPISNLKDIIEDILPFIRFPTMSLDYLHQHIVPYGFLFTYNKLSEILMDAAAFTRNDNKTQPVSGFSNKYRGRRIQLIDRNKNQANVYIFEKDIFNALQAFDGTMSRSTYNNTSEWGPWNSVNSPKMVVKPTENVAYYLVRNYNGYLSLKPKNGISSGEIILAPIYPVDSNFCGYNGNCMIKFPK